MQHAGWKGGGVTGGISHSISAVTLNCLWWVCLQRAHDMATARARPRVVWFVPLCIVYCRLFEPTVCAGAPMGAPHRAPGLFGARISLPCVFVVVYTMVL
jgi:hypothetical protein